MNWNTLSIKFRQAFISLPLLFIGCFLFIPLLLTIVVSFWEKTGLKFKPAFTFRSYEAIIEGARLIVLYRSLIVSATATIVCLMIAYPIAYFLARRSRPAVARIVLILFTIPFLINYIVRNVAWTSILSRTGIINILLQKFGLIDLSIDWLLYSYFSVYIGLVSTYMPFMIFPLFLSISTIEKSYFEASSDLGASAIKTFIQITIPLSMPGIFAALIFGFVGCMGESAVPIIMGGVGFELLGNTIASSMDVLNYPLAAALSSIVIFLMFGFLLGWFLIFDLKIFLGKLLEWKSN